MPTKLDINCLLAAVCFFGGNVLHVAMGILRVQRGPPDFDRLAQFDVDYIREEFDWIRSNIVLQHVGELISMLAWLLLLAPILQLTWCLSNGGTRKMGVHVIIVAFAFMGAFAEVLSRLMLFGFTEVALWMESRFELDNWLSEVENNDGLGWKALELTFLTVEGMHGWVDAFEWLCLSIIFLLMYYSASTQSNDDVAAAAHTTKKEIPKRVANVGLVIAVLSLFDFSADVLRYENLRVFTGIALLTNAVNTWILLPLFLVFLAHKLPTLTTTAQTEVVQAASAVETVQLNPTQASTTMTTTTATNIENAEPLV